MSNQPRVSLSTIQDPTSQVENPDSTDDQLLDSYLAMPRKLRERHFVDTATGAEMTGLSQRTIELWIETGSVRAVLVANRYHVTVSSLRHYVKRRAMKPS